ncbi:ABC transporter ATP-binding protein [Pontibacter chitinilyticus]|uniref:ABC transporter ATP-binding protein n=1 Tax=Pontibacter chitinilyticus TaxID=2674989 RepID=UPI003219A804
MENHPFCLSIHNVSKTYATATSRWGLSRVKEQPAAVQALDNVSLTIPPGMFGLLGPNGAGKSTLMRILATLQEPDSGSIQLGGIDVLHQKEQVRQTLGYLPQEFGVYPKVSAEDLLDYFAVLKGITNRPARKEVTEALLRQTNLWDKRKQKLGGFSGGMKQRFGVAVALMGNPKLLIVDEPTAGLDPAERVRFLNLLSKLGENSVVILSTHIVEDVSELCTNLAIINKGKILLEAQPQQVVEALQGKVWRILIDKNKLPAVAQEHQVISAKLLGGRTLVHVYSQQDPGTGFEEVMPDLEDVYFSTMTGFLDHTNQPLKAAEVQL